MALAIAPLHGDALGGLVGGVAGSSATGPFPLRPSRAVHLTCVVESISAGATVQVFLDLRLPGGGWVQVIALPAQSAVGAESQGTQTAAVSGDLISVGRLRWTISGGQASIAAFAAGVG